MIVKIEGNKIRFKTYNRHLGMKTRKQASLHFDANKQPSTQGAEVREWKVEF